MHSAVIVVSLKSHLQAFFRRENPTTAGSIAKWAVFQWSHGSGYQGILQQQEVARICLALPDCYLSLRKPRGCEWAVKRVETAIHCLASKLICDAGDLGCSILIPAAASWVEREGLGPAWRCCTRELVLWTSTATAKPNHRVVRTAHGGVPDLKVATELNSAFQTEISFFFFLTFIGMKCNYRSSYLVFLVCCWYVYAQEISIQST